MPNFPPLRSYVFAIVDRWIRRYRLNPPFLDVGCGTGEMAMHLARRGWEGIALDSSEEALARVRLALAAHPRVRLVENGLDGVPPGAAHTVFLLDVLEHIEDDAGLLCTLSEKTAPGGYLVVLTPVNPDEWEYDDELYGHIRRYGWDELPEKLKVAGFELLDSHDVTFPFFWVLRHLYLRWLPRRSQSVPREQLTAASSFFNPWSANSVMRAAGEIVGWPPLWRPLFLVQDLFARSRYGHAALFLARKKG